MKALRKSVLLIIITMSLFLTSGTSVALVAQERLENTLATLKAKNLQAEITVWVPVAQINYPEKSTSAAVFELPQGWSREVRRVAEEISGQHYTFDITTFKTTQITDLVKIYTRVRSKAMRTEVRGQRGGAYLTVSVDLPSNSDLKGLGQDALVLLGGQVRKQEMVTPNMYSVASDLPGWGATVWAGQDEINLQIIARPGSNPAITHLYLLAPDLIGDL